MTVIIIQDAEGRNLAKSDADPKNVRYLRADHVLTRASDGALVINNEGELRDNLTAEETAMAQAIIAA